MRWSVRHTLVAAILLVALLVASVSIFLQRQPGPLHLQQAVLLTNPLPLQDFELLDQHRQPVTSEDLKGQWHLLSYGFTYCPDICPMTLAKLSRFKLELEQQQQYNDIQLLFYTVDPVRDTPEVLQQYLAFFAADIRGLVAMDDSEQHKNFEQRLAILYEAGIADADDPMVYQVDHGVLLYLLNPNAELQAVFTPVSRVGTVPDFDPELLFQDYLAIRSFLQ